MGPVSSRGIGVNAQKIDFGQTRRKNLCPQSLLANSLGTTTKEPAVAAMAVVAEQTMAPGTKRQTKGQT